MKKRQPQRAVTAHGNSRDGARSASRGNAVAIFDRGQEFPQEKILVADAPVLRVDVEAGIASGCNHNELANLMAVPKLLHHIPGSEMEKHLLVVPQAMQIVEHGITAAL